MSTLSPEILQWNPSHVFTYDERGPAELIDRTSLFTASTASANQAGSPATANALALFARRDGAMTGVSLRFASSGAVGCVVDDDGDNRVQSSYCRSGRAAEYGPLWQHEAEWE